MTANHFNALSAHTASSRYVKAPHLNLCVDNTPLDEFIYRYTREESVLGLIPTWLGWLNDDAEQELVWQRSNLTEQSAVLPLLICPDDLDFSCTTLSAEIATSGDSVIWKRIGYDFTNGGERSCYRWLSQIPPLTFERGNYLATYRRFRDAAAAEALYG